MYKHCSNCHDREERRPRLSCDFFKHYMKYHRFKFRRVKKADSAHVGTYILITHEQVFVGDYNKLMKLAERLGGVPRKLNLVDDTF